MRFNRSSSQPAVPSLRDTANNFQKLLKKKIRGREVKTCRHWLFGKIQFIASKPRPSGEYHKKPPRQLPVRGFRQYRCDLLLHSFKNDLFFLRFGPNGGSRLDRSF